MYSTMKEDLEKALKKLMLTKPLNTINISDLTRECHISRMAFYYHFSDIYALVEWACLEDARKALQGKKTVDTWQEGYTQIVSRLGVIMNHAFSHSLEAFSRRP